MARIAYETKSFREDYRRADRQAQRRIDAFLKKFEEDTARSGTRLKRLGKNADRRVRTARIDKDWRAVLAVVDGDDHVLLRAMKHDEANAFAESHRLDVSCLTGLPRVIRLESVPVDTVPAPAVAGPLDHRSADDIFAAGVPREAVPALQALSDETDVRRFAAFLSGSDPLIEFAVDLLLDRYRSVDEIMSDILALSGDAAPNDADDGDAPTRPRYDTEDLTAALQRPGAGEQFRVIDDSDELIAALRGDLSDWQLFLHPLQRRAAYETRFTGPTRVSGGAGTGKTVVLLHRAKALLNRTRRDGYPPRILITTYTEHLRADLGDLLRRLVGETKAAEVQIDTVDSLARGLHDRMDGRAVDTLSADDELQLWEGILATQPNIRRTPLFASNEYRHVVLARGVRSPEAYLETPRVGRGTRLGRSERLALWPALEAFEAKTRGAGLRSALQLTEDVAALLERAPADLFDHILVDEAQDLHPAQWRLLRALVPAGPDDLFIVGDAFQRIYGNNASLRSVGIETRGRSIRLRRNYRSTREITSWALGVIGREAVLDIDEHGADLSGYHSVRSGPAPTLHALPDRGAELSRLVEIAHDGIAAGYPPDNIAIATRSADEIPGIVDALASAGIEAAQIGEAGRTPGVVNVATMHRLKGLEFACVAVAGLSAGNVPRLSEICPREVDPARHRADADAERALVYVAASRARDHLALTWSGEPSPLITPLTTHSETGA